MIKNDFLFFVPSFALTFAELRKVCRRLPWRLPNFGKSAVVCLDVCRTSGFNIRYALTFAELRHLTSVILWRLPNFGKAVGVCRDAVGAWLPVPPVDSERDESRSYACRKTSLYISVCSRLRRTRRLIVSLERESKRCLCAKPSNGSSNGRR